MNEMGALSISFVQQIAVAKTAADLLLIQTSSEAMIISDVSAQPEQRAEAAEARLRIAGFIQQRAVALEAIVRGELQALVQIGGVARRW